MTNNDDLTKRIKEIAAEQWPRCCETDLPLVSLEQIIIDSLIILAADPVLREELERPLRKEIETLKNVLSSDEDKFLSYLLEADKLRERIAELEADRTKKRLREHETEKELCRVSDLARERFNERDRLRSELLALQAQVAARDKALTEISKVRGSADKVRCLVDIESVRECATEALSSSPDMGLLDRVVEVIDLNDTAIYTNSENVRKQALEANSKLLRDLGATNPEQPK